MYTRTKALVTAIDNIKEINIEANIQRGMFAFSVLGTPYRYSKKIKEKIKVVLKQYNIKLPNKRITVEVEKCESKYNYDELDFAILVSILKLLNIKKFDNNNLYIGSISLLGELVPLEYPYRLINYYNDNQDVIINMPYDKKLVNLEMCQDLRMIEDIDGLLNNDYKLLKVFNFNEIKHDDDHDIDLNSIIGQENLIRALIIALAGRHHLIVTGVSGTGKSLSFKAIESIIPLSDRAELLEINNFTKDDETFITKLQVNKLEKNITLNQLKGSTRKISRLKMLIPSVVVLEELNNYSKNILEFLKEEMDYDRIDSNYKGQLTIFANMNPCPCGNYGSKVNTCKCSMGEISRFENALKKPFYDRFQIKVRTDSEYNIQDTKNKYNIDEVRNKIKTAWDMQKERYKDLGIRYNAFLTVDELEHYIGLEDKLERKLSELTEFYKLSLRQKHNIIKIARTIADYDHEDKIKADHLYEAISYQII